MSTVGSEDNPPPQSSNSLFVTSTESEGAAEGLQLRKLRKVHGGDSCLLHARLAPLGRRCSASAPSETSQLGPFCTPASFSNRESGTPVHSTATRHRVNVTHRQARLRIVRAMEHGGAVAVAFQEVNP